MEPPALTRRLWRDRSGRPWLLVFRWAVVDGRVECVDLRVRSQPDPDEDPFGDHADVLEASPVTATLLRELPIASLIDFEKRQEVGKLKRWLGPPMTVRPAARSDLEQQLGALEPRMGRPPKYGPDFYRRVAEIYSEARHYGEERPVAAVARLLGAGSRATAAKWVATAREFYEFPGGRKPRFRKEDGA